MNLILSAGLLIGGFGIFMAALIRAKERAE
jgi:hypothetical protein